MTDLAAARARLVVALDTSDRTTILRLAGTLANRVGVLKVGLEAFTAHGPALVGEIRALGVPVFLDLKLHDIPNTVERAAANCARLGVAMLTVHASGGAAMLEAAVRGVAAGTPPGATPPKVLAVTVLTSLDDGALDELGIAGPAGARVRGWAALARRAGCDGVICSPHEAAALRGELGAGFLLVTPGIRPAGGAAADQKRIATPAAAITAGADYLVIGRPITGAADAIAGELATVLPPPSGTRGTVDREPPESA